MVLDATLPGFSGFGVERRLRSAGRGMPIVMVTARDSVEDRIHGLDSGADDYLVKPFNFAELAARIRALSRRGVQQRSPTLSVGDLRLDPASRQVFRGEVELDLSPKEFSLLELFMENPGVVLTRTLIIEQLWDYEYDGMSNVVDRYVGYLRRKIDRPFAQDDVQTVRGVGYLLKAPVSRYADPGPPCHCHHDRHRSCCRLRRLDLRHHLGASTSQFARRRADSPGGCCFPTIAASSSNHVVTSGRPA